MLKAKHPANVVLLTASENFLLNIAHICPIISESVFIVSRFLT